MGEHAGMNGGRETASPIQRITIVGGGTAGWLTAAYLNHRLQWGLTKRPGVVVTVIEPPDIPTVGVGEATVPSIVATLRMLEISEAEFIKRTDASFKLAIRFDGWQAPSASGRPSVFHHPFTAEPLMHGRDPADSFLAHGLTGGEGAASQDLLPAICAACPAVEGLRGPVEIGARPVNAALRDAALRYAYHVDAAKLAAFLKEVCLARGVVCLSDRVVETRLDDRGYISTLALREHGDHAAELFVDCTGFGGLLINQALGEPFVSFRDYLPNDRAIPIQFARPDASVITPATVSTSMKAGWSWRVPLYSRDGTGYVYSSTFLSDDEAADELCAHGGDARRLTEPRVLHMRIGRTRRSWVNNCVAIGLSGGFLEPLESTAIWSIEMACRRLLQFFPTTAFEPPLARAFNAAMERMYEEVRDFLSLHFTLSTRADTDYWRATRELKRSDALEAALELWRHALPSHVDVRDATLFPAVSVRTVLLGKGFYDGARLSGGEVAPPAVWRGYLAQQRRAQRP